MTSLSIPMSPQSAALKPTCAEWGSSTKQLRVRLSRPDRQRIAHLQDFHEKHLGIRPTANVAVRHALLFTVDMLCGADPANPDTETLRARLIAAVQGL